MRPGDVLRDRYREVLFGEVWNGTSSPPGGVAETKVSERLAEFPFLSHSLAVDFEQGWRPLSFTTSVDKPATGFGSNSPRCWFIAQVMRPHS
jgi:hypothetical protein